MTETAVVLTGIVISTVATLLGIAFTSGRVASKIEDVKADLPKIWQRLDEHDRDIATVKARFDNGVTAKIEKHDRDLARIKQAHADRTGCPIQDSGA
jgi:argininosuccinate synthase